ncbi:MAG: Metallophosphoesterase [Rhizorhabdus sp.]|nr:Metallophosphoesterase [Rhizorhabdus sp.]
MIRLFHISDLHFGCEDAAALRWFETVVAAEAPDAIVVTGDLTMRARPAEFRAAGTWLKALGRPVTIKVGNHDLPYFDLFARFARPYRRYEAIERMIERPLDLPGVVVVPLKTTARFQWRLNWSKGFVSKRSLQQALAAVAAAPADALILVACHHPLLEGGTRMRSETRNGPPALEALAAAGVDAVLTGHVHDPFDLVRDVAGRPVRLIGAGTLSQRVRATRPSFNEIRIDGAIETVLRNMV